MADANRQSAGTVWLPTGNPDTTNISSTDFNSMGGQPGSLGVRFEASPASNAYQRVQLDSGAVAANGVGIVAANQLAYWKDKSKYLVTNDFRQANAANMQGVSFSNSGFRNFAAGIFRMAVTAGSICDILQRGQSISVKTTGTPLRGEAIVSDTTASTAQGINVAVGTAPTAKIIGYVAGATTSNVTPVDVDIPEVQ